MLFCSAAIPASAEDRPGPGASPNREQIEQRLHAVKERIMQLEKEGKHDEAQRLKQEAYQMIQKARGAEGDRARPDSAPRGAEAEKIRDRLKEMSQKIAQLEKEGKHDEARRLKEEAQAIMRRISGQSREAAPPAGGNREARLRHLRAAAENLKAAGFEAEAQHVMQLIHRAESETHGERGRPAPEAPRDRAHERPAPGPAREHEIPPAVRELHRQVEQMQREMRELREELKRARSGEKK
jgi:hypothetical protein